MSPSASRRICCTGCLRVISRRWETLKKCRMMNAECRMKNIHAESITTTQPSRCPRYSEDPDSRQIRNLDRLDRGKEHEGIMVLALQDGYSHAGRRGMEFSLERFQSDTSDARWSWCCSRGVRASNGIHGDQFQRHLSPSCVPARTTMHTLRQGAANTRGFQML